MGGELALKEGTDNRVEYGAEDTRDGSHTLFILPPHVYSVKVFLHHVCFSAFRAVGDFNRASKTVPKALRVKVGERKCNCLCGMMMMIFLLVLGRLQCESVYSASQWIVVDEMIGRFAMRIACRISRRGVQPM